MESQTYALNDEGEVVNSETGDVLTEPVASDNPEFDHELQRVLDAYVHKGKVVECECIGMASGYTGKVRMEFEAPNMKVSFTSKIAPDSDFMRVVEHCGVEVEEAQLIPQSGMTVPLKYTGTSWVFAFDEKEEPRTIQDREYKNLYSVDMFLTMFLQSHDVGDAPRVDMFFASILFFVGTWALIPIDMYFMWKNGEGDWVNSLFASLGVFVFWLLTWVMMLIVVPKLWYVISALI